MALVTRAPRCARLRRLMPLLAAVPFVACGKGPSGGAAGGSTATANGERLDAIFAAEERRVSAEITSADQQSRDVHVRRAAARALSRIGGEGARPGLYRALSDEDDE